jgi:hypothetical protein
MTGDFVLGAVVRSARGYHFVQAPTPSRVVPNTKITAVPGSRLGIALVDDQVVNVLSLGPQSGHFLVCDVGGRTLALSGVHVEATGRFPSSGRGCAFLGRTVAPLDVASELRSEILATVERSGETGRGQV